MTQFGHFNHTIKTVLAPREQQLFGSQNYLALKGSRYFHSIIIIRNFFLATHIVMYRDVLGCEPALTCHLSHYSKLQNIHSTIIFKLLY